MYKGIKSERFLVMSIGHGVCAAMLCYISIMLFVWGSPFGTAYTILGAICTMLFLYTCVLFARYYVKSRREDLTSVSSDDDSDNNNNFSN